MLKLTRVTQAKNVLSNQCEHTLKITFLLKKGLNVCVFYSCWCLPLNDTQPASTGPLVDHLLCHVVSEFCVW